jgi:hypothetical protein
MKDREQAQSDDEIEAEVLAKLGDPEAWEPLPPVPPATSPRPEWAIRAKHLQLAAKFHVLSILHLHGAEANLALSQPENVDVIVFNRLGAALTIQVKTLPSSREWVVDPFTVRRHHFVVFVGFASAAQGSEIAPDVFVVASETLRDFVARESLRKVRIDELDQKLKIRNAWQPLLAEAAA